MGAAFDVPPHLAQPTGVWVCDVLPLLTIASCLPTLQLCWRAGRYSDLVLYTIGFLLATLYHLCHMDSVGLEHSSLLGVPGPVWRRWDIASAMMCLARVWGIALGACQQVTLAFPNVIFPAYILGLVSLFPRVQTIYVALVVLFTLLITALLKVVVEGAETFPKYSEGTGFRVLLWFILGFVTFALPTKMPDLYWFWHSCWHIFLALGYYDLYSELERQKQF